MAEGTNPEIGKISWTDLTVENAEDIRDFYQAVVGWNPEPVGMGEYSDYNMTAPATGVAAAGICHARGVNAELPAQWLIYITVDDVASCAEKCVERGGKILVGPKKMGDQGGYCVIQDPAGAVAALYQPS
jgi:predicted enzyme related to lactoylglutathione lyase